MGQLVIAVYRPHAGQEAALLALVRGHVPFLRGLGLVTDRAPVLMRAAGGEILEVFEWKDGAVADAHEHPEVQALWNRFGAVCDYVPLSALTEAEQPFAGFEPLQPAS